MVVDAVSKPLELDRRELVPPTGLREFWYPALLAKKVGRKPVKMRLLGEELCFFRDEDGKVAALWDVCPHRGPASRQGTTTIAERSPAPTTAGPSTGAATAWRC